MKRPFDDIAAPVGAPASMENVRRSDKSISIAAAVNVRVVPALAV